MNEIICREMMSMVEQEKKFTRAIADLSTDQKFQYEFFCDRCGKGARTPAKGFFLGKVSGAVDAANTIFGGALDKAVDWSEKMRQSSYERAREQFMEEAFKALEPGFAQCPGCSQWICRQDCWDVKTGHCKDCAPNAPILPTAEEPEPEAVAPSGDTSTSPQPVPAVQTSSEGQLTPQEKIQPKSAQRTCTNCGGGLRENARFCPVCGEKVTQDAFCVECGTRLPPNAKFCPECGSKTPALSS